MKNKIPPSSPQQRNTKTLPAKFYQRDTITVAKELLGKKLVRQLSNGKILSGIIVEVEAYLGIKDRACHTYAGKRTQRTEPMYLDGAHSYIYLIYGMYDCFNVVTQSKEIPEAVLVRALEPVDGIEQMMRYRKTNNIHNLCSGPGKLCEALRINRELNGHLLTDLSLRIEDTEINITPKMICKKPRIGVEYAGSHAHWPLRFYIKNNNFVSKKYKLVP